VKVSLGECTVAAEHVPGEIQSVEEGEWKRVSGEVKGDRRGKRGGAKLRLSSPTFVGKQAGRARDSKPGDVTKNLIRSPEN